MIVDKIQDWLNAKDITIEDWLARQYGYMAEASIKKQFSKREKGSVLRFSGAGKGARQIAYEYHDFPENGKKMNARSRLVFLYGDLLEALMVTLCKASGVQLTACGLDQKTISTTLGGVEVKGHLDGLHVGNPIRTVEFKSMSSFAFEQLQKGVIDHTYLVQVNLGMNATGLDECIFVGIEKESGAMHETILSYDKTYVTWANNNISQVVSSTKEILPARCFSPSKLKDGNSYYPWNCSYCKFYNTCLVEPGLAELVVVKGSYKLKAIDAKKM